MHNIRNSFYCSSLQSSKEEGKYFDICTMFYPNMTGSWGVSCLKCCQVWAHSLVSAYLIFAKSFFTMYRLELTMPVSSGHALWLCLEWKKKLKPNPLFKSGSSLLTTQWHDHLSSRHCCLAYSRDNSARDLPNGPCWSHSSYLISICNTSLHVYVVCQ